MPNYPKAYVDYLVQFHGSRDYFECHEILEEFWKMNGASREDKMWLGLIQTAVAMYHHRRSNIRGAAKMLDIAIENLSQQPLGQLGIDKEGFLNRLREQSKELMVQPEKPFADLDIPLTDPALLAECEAICRSKGWDWAMPSHMDNADLIHKHTLRDRTDVIERRSQELQRRLSIKQQSGLHST